MSFVSLNFALFVIITIAVFYSVPKKYQWIILLIASYVFYCINGFKYIAYILVNTISTYLCAYYISKSLLKQKAFLKANKDISKEEKKQIKLESKPNKKKNKGKIISVILAFVLLIVGGSGYFIIQNKKVSQYKEDAESFCITVLSAAAGIRRTRAYSNMR